MTTMHREVLHGLLVTAAWLLVAVLGGVLVYYMPRLVDWMLANG